MCLLSHLTPALVPKVKDFFCLGLYTLLSAFFPDANTTGTKGSTMVAEGGGGGGGEGATGRSDHLILTVLVRLPDTLNNLLLIPQVNTHIEVLNV